MAIEERLIDANSIKYHEQRTCGGHGIFWTDLIVTKEEIDHIPAVDAIPVTADELKHLMNDTIAYIWRLEDRGCDKPEFGYDSRKALLEKLKKFYNEHFPESDCHF